MKHTKGPWEVGHTMNTNIRKNRAIVSDYGTPEEMLVAEVCGNTPGSECGANARLIAAAPEMLEACLISRPVLQQIYKDDPHNIAARNALRYLDHAIKKAEGE